MVTTILTDSKKLVADKDCCSVVTSSIAIQCLETLIHSVSKCLFYFVAF